MNIDTKGDGSDNHNNAFQFRFKSGALTAKEFSLVSRLSCLCFQFQIIDVCVSDFRL